MTVITPNYEVFTVWQIRVKHLTYTISLKSPNKSMRKAVVLLQMRMFVHLVPFKKIYIFFIPGIFSILWEFKSERFLQSAGGYTQQVVDPDLNP